MESDQMLWDMLKSHIGHQRKPSEGKLPVSSNGSPLFHLTAGSGSS